MDIKDRYIELYKDGFEEDVQEYVEYFFDNLYSEENAMMNEEQTSALHIRYKSLVYGGNAIVFPFFVGVSTLKIKRGTGEIADLIRRALSRLKDEKVAFVGLYPFRHDYYTKYGFVTVDKMLEFVNSPDFCTVSQSLTTDLLDKYMDVYYNLYTDFCKVFDIYLLRTKEDMLLKFKGMLPDDTKMIQYTRGGNMVAYRLYANGALEDMASREKSLIEYSQKENAQCRVIDIKVALESYAYDCKDCAFCFNVQDNMLGDSCWHIAIQNVKGKARELKALTVDCITLTVQQLTLLLLCGENAEEYGLSQVFKKVKTFIVDKY